MTSRYLYKLRERAYDEGHFEKYLNELLEDKKALAEMVYHSNSMEGSTVTMSDTLRAVNTIHVMAEIETKDLEGNYTTREISDVQGLANAALLMYDNIDNKYLTEELVLNLHSEACAGDMTQVAGVYKSSDNYTTHNGEIHRYLPADKVQNAMDKLIRDYNNSGFDMEAIARMTMEFTQIHPFSDGNGRVSRLLLNWALMSNKYPPIIIKVEEKAEYIKMLRNFDTNNDEVEFSYYIENKVMAALEVITSRY